GIVLFGTVAVSGIRTLGKVSYDGTGNMVIVAASLGAGMLPVVNPDIYSAFPTWFQTIFHSGISSAAVVAVALNLLFNELKAGNPPEGKGSVFARAPLRGISYESLEHLSQQLQEGDHVEGGRLVDCHGQEVPVITAEGEGVDVPICERVEEPAQGLATTAADPAAPAGSDRPAAAVVSRSEDGAEPARPLEGRR